MDNDGLNLLQSCKKVEELTGIPAHTLRRAFQRSLKPKIRAHGNRLLTDIQERVLVGLLIANSCIKTSRNRSWPPETSIQLARPCMGTLLFKTT